MVRFASFLLGAALVAAGAWSCSRGAGDRPRVLVIGLDSADWRVLDPLIEQGRLPHLAKLKREGVSGDLLTLSDIALSPVIWTSIVTGKEPAEHGITWFLVDTPDGRQVPVRSHNRRVKALWNILAERQRAAGVIGWWASAPAEPVGPGVIVSDALGFHGFGRVAEGVPDDRKVYPPELHDGLQALVPPEQQVDYGYGRRFFHMSSEEYYREAFRPGRDRRPDPANPIHLFQQYTATTLGYTDIARRLLETRDLDLLAVYYESGDSMSHLFMKYAAPKLEWVDRAEHGRFKDVVDEYYVFIDEQLGRVLEKVPDDWAVVVVSDHGFRIGANRPKSTQTVDMRGAHLDHEPEGVFIARGPRFERGATIEGGTVLDVTPTLLHALGLPVGRDMTGRVLTDAFTAEFMERHPIAYVSTYEDATTRAGALTDVPVSDEEAADAIARLEMLGYVSGGSARRSEGDARSDPNEESATSPEQQNNLGALLLADGDLDGAQREFEAVLDGDPENAAARTNVGRVHLARGNAEQALRCFLRALQSNPNHVDALTQLASLRRDRGELATAETLYRQVLAIEDRLPGPFIGLGDVLLRQNRLEEARDQFQHAAELDPRDATAQYNLGVALAKLEDLDGATAAYETALEVVPDHFLALNNLGDCLLRQGRRDEALVLFRKAASANPQHVESRFNVGSLLLQDGEWAEARRWLEEAAALRPDMELIQNRLALSVHMSGDVEEATRRYQALTRVFPASPFACVQLARIARAAGQDEEAATWLRHAVSRGGEPTKQAILGDPAFDGVEFEEPE